MAMLHGVNVHMDMVNGELTIHLPDGRNIGFAARAYVGDVLIALDQHAAQQNTAWHAGNTSQSLSIAFNGGGNAMHGQGRDVTIVRQPIDTNQSTSHPTPTPCGWCGFTTEHASACAFVPREAREV